MHIADNLNMDTMNSLHYFTIIYLTFVGHTLLGVT